MPKTSAGILVYRLREGRLEVFLVHPGGPFWARKDTGAWSIPKGEFAEPEDPLEAAIREFQEETGFPIQGTFLSLPPRKQQDRSGATRFSSNGQRGRAAGRSSPKSIGPNGLEFRRRSGGFS